MPPPGASEAAEAYVAAVNASGSAWGALSDHLEQQDFVMYLEDLQAQVDADAPFVRAVRAIDFPGPARPAATAFVLAVMKYDRFLVQTVQAGEFGPSFQAVDDAVNAQRAQRSSELRDALGLDGSPCTLNRP